MVRMLAFVGALAWSLVAWNTGLGQFVPKIGPGVKVGPVIPNLGGVGGVTPAITPTLPNAPSLGTTLPTIDTPMLPEPAVMAPTTAVEANPSDTRPSYPTPAQPVTRSVRSSRTQTSDTYFSSQDQPLVGGGGEPPEGGNGDGDEGEDDDEEEAEDEDEDEEPSEATNWWPWLAGAGAVLLAGFWFFR